MSAPATPYIRETHTHRSLSLSLLAGLPLEHLARVHMRRAKALAHVLDSVDIPLLPVPAGFGGVVRLVRRGRALVLLRLRMPRIVTPQLDRHLRDGRVRLLGKGGTLVRGDLLGLILPLAAELAQLHVQRHRDARKLAELAQVDHRLRVGRLLERLRPVVVVPPRGAAVLAVHELAVDPQAHRVLERHVHASLSCALSRRRGVQVSSAAREERCLCPLLLLRNKHINTWIGTEHG